MTDIVNASENGDLNLVKQLYTNCENSYTYIIQAFYVAVANGYLNIVKYFQKKWTFNETETEHASDIAIENRHTEVVLYLNNLQSEWDDIFDYEYSLDSAFIRKNFKLIKYLCENCVTYDEALTRAVLRENLDMIEFLHKNGANIDTNDDAMLTAVSQKNLQIVKYLHKNGANINACDDCVLRIAVKDSSLEIIKYLLQNGAQINKKYFRYVDNARYFCGHFCIRENGQEITLKPEIQEELREFYHRRFSKTKSATTSLSSKFCNTSNE